MKLPFRHVFNLVLVVILVAFVVTAAGYNPQARLMPLVIGIPVLALAIWQTANDWRTSGGDTRMHASTKEMRSDREEGAPTGRFRQELRVFLWTLALFVLLYLFGFIITTCVYTFLSLKVRSRLNWVTSVAISAGAFAFLYGVMIYALQVQLYPGIVVLALRRALYGY